MILVGACWQADHLTGGVAVMEASLKQGEKRYRIDRYDERRYTEAEAFRDSVASLVEGEKLQRTKRLFSQDRRPKKRIKDAPKVVAFDDGGPVVEALRARGTVVEAVRFVPGEKWKKELLGRALGADYAVDPTEVSTSAARVIEGGRLAFADPAAEGGFDRLPGALASLARTRPEQIPAVVLALALPLWFRETVPYRRAYRAT
ncbi:MAG: hypothetical protein PVG78_18590 [Desulfobacterales bacterium]